MDRTEERRAGAALVRESKTFAQEDLATTWRLFGASVAVYLGFEAVALFAPWWPLQLLGAVGAGLVIVRLFIFYHDYLHGAVFRDSVVGHWVMVAYGWFIMSPAPVWRETHDYHHRNNAKMLGASIGSFPIVTTTMWRRMKPRDRFWYSVARNPLTILFGYLTVFIAGMCISAFVRDPKNHWQGPCALAVHLASIGVVGWFLGPWAALVGVVMPMFVACGTGSYLFYAQHNFPAAELRSREAWTYHHAALRASSMFDMPGWMHWFTGNIGYHHVHHLNHQIPFYRLPEAMEEMEALQDPGRTTWRPSDVWACLRLKLWDNERQALVGWDEARAAS
ncbi:MAG: fatty acid desaturase [Myxococcales bacterium]|nr:fatty acid desaturase [Myxococcales bacterium]